MSAGDKNHLIIEQLYVRDTCVRCRLTYLRIDNLGAWKCRHHPGERSPFDLLDAARGHYTCCNRTDPRGCKRADHLSEHTLATAPRLHEPTLTVPADIAEQHLPQLLHTSKPGIDYHAAYDELVIYRHEDDGVL